MDIKDKYYNALKKGYYIDKNGEVFSSKNNKLKLLVKKKYLFFSLRNGKKVDSLYVHRYQAFIKFGDELFKDNIEVRHLNGNNYDNSYNNILLGTRSENMLDKTSVMRLNQALNATSQVKKHRHIDIINDYNLGLSYKDLMIKYDISSKGTISYIIKKSFDSKK